MPDPINGLAAMLPDMQHRAAALDEAGAYPVDDMAALRSLGLLAAPLPRHVGGLGAGTDPAEWPAALALLRLLGQGNPAVGRLVEAHVNALRLIARFGSPAQLRWAADRGGLFGLWVTDDPKQPLTLEGRVLRGRKSPCSGAGHAESVLVTVGTPEGTRMAVLPAAGIRTAPLPGVLTGMRAAANGTSDFTGLDLPDGALLGAPGDYLREPDFSCGAWRTTAVTLGALEALVDAVRAQLVGRGHHAAPLQQERFGLMLIARETARLWTTEAARRAELDGDVAYVNLARIAVESASLDAMRHAQRALGLAAFMRPNPVERLLRDLSVYLRQPAPDSVLCEAAAHHLAPA